VKKGFLFLAVSLIVTGFVACKKNEINNNNNNGCPQGYYGPDCTIAWSTSAIGKWQDNNTFYDIKSIISDPQKINIDVTTSSSGGTLVSFDLPGTMKDSLSFNFDGGLASISYYNMGGVTTLDSIWIVSGSGTKYASGAQMDTKMELKHHTTYTYDGGGPNDTDDTTYTVQVNSIWSKY
jgi:hypothetical protein